MERLPFGFVGAGGITHGHAQRIIASGEAEVVAVTEPDPGSVAHFREATAPAPAVHSTLEAMLEAERLDCALITSPHTLHFAQSRAGPPENRAAALPLHGWRDRRGSPHAPALRTSGPLSGS